MKNGPILWQQGGGEELHAVRGARENKTARRTEFDKHLRKTALKSFGVEQEGVHNVRCIPPPPPPPPKKKTPHSPTLITFLENDMTFCSWLKIEIYVSLFRGPMCMPCCPLTSENPPDTFIGTKSQINNWHCYKQIKSNLLPKDTFQMLKQLLCTSFFFTN